MKRVLILFMFSLFLLGLSPPSYSVEVSNPKEEVEEICPVQDIDLATITNYVTDMEVEISPGDSYVMTDGREDRSCELIIGDIVNNYNEKIRESWRESYDRYILTNNLKIESKYLVNGSLLEISPGDNSSNV